MLGQSGTQPGWESRAGAVAGEILYVFPTPVLSEMKDLGSPPSFWKECPCDAALKSKTHLPRFELAAICTSDLIF
jgi:hypothetical protein